MATKRKEGMTMADQNGATAVAEANEAATVATGNDDRLTILEAAEYLGVNVQTFRNTIKNRPEFTAAGVVIHEPVKGSKYELVKISQSAIDAYKANRESGDGIKMRDGTRKFIVKLNADQIEAFKSGQLDTTTIELVPASQRSTKAAVADGAATAEASDEAPSDQPDNDLAGASADNTESNEDQGSLFAGLQDEGYTHSESDNGQRW